RSDQKIAMSIDGDLTIAERQGGEGKLAGLRQSLLSDLTLPPPKPASETSRSAPVGASRSITIALPPGEELADTAKPDANGWGFEAGYPNHTSLGEVSQSPVSSKLELEAKSITNAGALTHGDPEWVGNLDHPTPGNSTTNHFVGRFAFDTSTQLKGGKVDELNSESAKIPAQSGTTSLAINSTHSLNQPDANLGINQEP